MNMMFKFWSGKKWYWYFMTMTKTFKLYGRIRIFLLSRFEWLFNNFLIYSADDPDPPVGTVDISKAPKY